ncbi:SDR family NAD(P)-dependent oxidoreductase [Hymenobacter sp. HMF4947]|uniref:SDR family NAD(P)-dependent oxidoreductase n=1 Tax=Hymenobacter ginkgonis TaxID=2682976 RepID=A0A7K1TC17_9BACT|nr:SDR family oxidoreductase [Hymenobacter ginkgonis]MVN75939.1 SDR family NAD(P)-dependent oxidoreductase [Hymenobacter ginkgonis]
MEKQAKKVALITGANKGLGLEIARQLGQQGLAVVLGARQGKAEAPAAELRAQGLDARAVELDVTNAADIAALPQFLQDNYGRLDVVVNNAGVQLDEGFDVSPDTLRRTYEANVIGPYAITQALLPLLRQAPAGRIVNQSSILGSLATISAGEGGSWATPGYTSSKAALNMLTVVLAQHLAATNIKVNAAHPGWVKTDMGGENAPLDVREGAQTAVRLALLPADGPTGGYFHGTETLAW